MGATSATPVPRPRVTISINAPNEQLESEFLTLDLPVGSTLAELKSIVQAETNLPVSSQHFYFNGSPLRVDTQTLEDAKVGDGEMLALLIQRPNAQGSSSAQASAKGGQQDRAAREIAEIESTRTRILADPMAMTQLIHQQPVLAQVIHDPVKFRTTWAALKATQNDSQRQHDERNAKLNADPFDVKAQKEIEDMIRRERIEENRQYAYENNPAAFTQVTMLYVDVKVNGHPIKAFVDSGAQATIMSPTCAEACNIFHLLDDRFAGIARGVGTAKILGRVHNAKIEIGDAELDCSFTVMEGRDVDLLFGLDMLKRHQACIDLRTSELVFPHTRVPFLGESEIPKRWEQELKDEPVVAGPDGTEIGAISGTVRAAGSAAEAAKALREDNQAAPASNIAAASNSGSSAAPLATTSQSASTTATQSTMRYSEKDVSQLVSMGFTRGDAINALDATGGNVELAAGLLFD